MSIYILLNVLNRLPRWLSGKEPTCQCKRHGFDPWVRKIPWRKRWQPTPVGNFFFFKWRLITLQYCGGFCHMFTWENTTETCILSYAKHITSPGSMYESGCSGLVPWDDPERWEGEGGGREGQDGEHMYTHGWFSGEILAWEIPWAVAPSRLESEESQNSQALLSD